MQVRGRRRRRGVKIMHYLWWFIILNSIIKVYIKGAKEGKR